MPAIYTDDCYCDSCADALREFLRKSATAAELEDWDSGNETCWDSGEYPKDMDDDEEADCPQHCGSGAECLEAEELSDGTKIGALLSTSLTCDGVEYVKEAVRKGGPCAEFWRAAFSWIDFPDGPTNDDIDEFTDAYLVALAFTATDPEGGAAREWSNPGGDIRDVVSADDVRAVLSADERREIAADCESFATEHWADIGDDVERAAADFHFTRNRAGAGFWDGDWPDAVGKRLTKAAHAYGTCEIMLELDTDGGIVSACLTH